jgi:hypothetical protein
MLARDKRASLFAWYVLEEENKSFMTSGNQIEFAENYFNDHEKSPSGTIVGTLKRGGTGIGGKGGETVAKKDMVSFYKGTSIPSSHIHMFDPENVNIACNIFKVKNIHFWGHAVSVITNGREPRSCLGRVFSSKLGCIATLGDKCKVCMQPLLKLKTRPKARPVS